MPTSGPELRRLRTAEWPRVTVTELARELGVHRVTVHLWEASPAIDDERADRYREALHRILTSRNVASFPREGDDDE